MELPNSFPDLINPGKFIDIIPGRRAGKLERLELHLTNHAELGKPVVVFAALKPQQREILKLARSLGLRAELLNGDTPTAKRPKIDDAFQRGELNCIVASPIVADVGFN